MTEAGWYPDSEEPNISRWWDGEKWTDDVKPLSTPESPVVAPTRPVIPRRELPPKLPPLKSSPAAPPALPSSGRPLSLRPSLPPPIPPTTTVGFRPPSEMPGIFPGIPKRPLPPSLPPKPALPPQTNTGLGVRDAGLSYGLSPLDAPETTPVEPLQTHTGVGVRDAGLSYGLASPSSPEAPPAVEPQPVEYLTPASPDEYSSVQAPEPAASGDNENGRAIPVKKFWTKTTLIVSSVAVLLTALVPVGLTLYSESVYQRADTATEGFLKGVAGGDDSWVAHATPDSFDEYYVPIRGSLEAAELSDVDVSIETARIYYNNPCLEMDFNYYSSNPTSCSDKAKVDIFTTYTVADKYEVSASQSLFLSRPFYYGDDENPQPAKAGERPSSVGAWSVSDIKINHLDTENSEFYAVADEVEVLPEDTNAPSCYSVDETFVHMSEGARIDEVLPSECSVSPDDRVTGESVVSEELVKSFPILNGATVQNLKNMTGVSDFSGSYALPYSQYEIPTDSGTYIFSFILAKGEGSSLESRLLSITKKPEMSADTEIETDDNEN